MEDSSKDNEAELHSRMLCLQENESLKYFANAYSFRENKHIVSEKSDLEVNKNTLNTAKFGVQTILVNLGEISLDQVTLNSAGIDYLVNFKPKESANEMIKQAEQIEKGMTFGEYKYHKSLPVEENMTFALRSIGYDGKKLSSGKNADVIVAFRIIRRDADGAITILWKELSRKKGLEIIN